MPISNEPEHREVGIPVVHLAEATARHDVAASSAAAATSWRGIRRLRVSAPATVQRCEPAALAACSKVALAMVCCPRSARRSAHARTPQAQPWCAAASRDSQTRIAPGACFGVASANVLLSGNTRSFCTREYRSWKRTDGDGGTAASASCATLVFASAAALSTLSPATRSARENSVPELSGSQASRRHSEPIPSPKPMNDLPNSGRTI